MAQYINKDALVAVIKHHIKKDCPIAAYCETMISSTRLCYSYIQPKLQEL